MRPVLVSLLCIFFIGTVATYARIADWLAPSQPVYQFQNAAGDYSVKVTTNYDLANRENNVLLRLNGEVLLSSNKQIEEGVPLRLNNLPIRVGENFLYVEVAAPKKATQEKLDSAAAFLLGSPVDEEPQKLKFQFVRVQIFRDGIPVTDGDVTTHLDSKDFAITEIFFSAFESPSTRVDH